MVRIYKLIVEGKQIGDIYYNWDEVLFNARWLFIEFLNDVEIWGAEEHDVIPHDMLEWTELKQPWV